MNLREGSLRRKYWDQKSATPIASWFSKCSRHISYLAFSIKRYDKYDGKVA